MAEVRPEEHSNEPVFQDPALVLEGPRLPDLYCGNAAMVNSVSLQPVDGAKPALLNNAALSLAATKPERLGSSTDDVTDDLKTYLKGIGKYPLLTVQQEIDLAGAINVGSQAAETLAEAGDLSDAQRVYYENIIAAGKQAGREFIQANLRLVVSIAKKYQSSGLSLLDLIQEGNLGLIRAVEKFDARKGFKFSTYATWWIRQSITRGIANTGRTIRLPVHAGDALARVMRARGVLFQQTGHEPSIEAIAAEAQMSESQVIEIMGYVSEPISLSEPLRAGEEADLGDVVGDRHAVSPMEATVDLIAAEELAAQMTKLDPEEQRVLVLLYGFDRGVPQSVAQTANVLGLTQPYVKGVERRALAALRRSGLPNPSQRESDPPMPDEREDDQLNQRSVERPLNSADSPNEVAAAVIALRKSGLSFEQIDSSLGMSSGKSRVYYNQSQRR